MLHLHTTRSYMRKGSQKDYWQAQWSARDLGAQIRSAPKKAWWPILDRIVEPLSAESLILEAGCGMGQFVYLLHQRGKTVIGVDITEVELARSKRACPELNLQIQDVRNLAFADESVDLMVSLGVVEHFEEGPDQVLAEACRVISPGGILFITVPYTNLIRRMQEPFRTVLHNFYNPLSHGMTFYQYTFSRRRFLDKLRQYGFTPIETMLHHSHVTVRKDWPRLGRFLFSPLRNDRKRIRRWTDRIDRLSPKILSHMLLVVAQKDATGRPHDRTSPQRKDR